MSDLKNLRNTGIVRIGPDNQAGVPATVVVVGVPRSGTSMAANALHDAGVFLGNEYEPGVFEDREVARALENDDMTSLNLLARNNDLMHGVWGFKRPKAYQQMEDVLQQLRAPRIVMVTRDPVAIAVRNNISILQDTIAAIEQAAKATLNIASIISTLSCPALIVSYEKAMAAPRDFCAALLAFLGIADEGGRLERMTAGVQNGPDAYLKATRILYDGEFSIAADGTIDGWIMCNSSAFPVIDLMHDGKRLQELAYGPKFKRPPAPEFAGGFFRTKHLAGKLPPGKAGEDVYAQARDTVFRLRRTPPP